MRKYLFFLFGLALLWPETATAQPFSAQIEAARGRLKLYTTAQLPTLCFPGMVVFDTTTQTLKVCQNNGTSWVAAGSGGTPGGSDGQVQYNNANAFGGVVGINLTAGTLTSLDIGATDTTITRSAAGVVAVEGVDLASLSGAQSLTNKTIPSFELGTAATDTTITRLSAGAVGIEGSRIMTIGSDSTAQIVSAAYTWSQGQTMSTDFGWTWGTTARLKYSSSMTPDSFTLQVPVASLSVHIIDNNDTFSDALNGPCGSALCGQPTLIADPKTPDGSQYLGRAYYGDSGFALKALTAGSATSLVNIPVAASAGSGGQIRYCVFAADATDQQSRCGVVQFAVSNKAGTETCAVYGIDTLFSVNPDQTKDGSSAGAISSGTLTYTWASSNSPTNACAFSLNAASSLTETTLVARYRVDMTGPGEPAPQ